MHRAWHNISCAHIQYRRRHMAKILPIQRKTLSNQSINIQFQYKWNKRCLFLSLLEYTIKKTNLLLSVYKTQGEISPFSWLNGDRMMAEWRWGTWISVAFQSPFSDHSVYWITPTNVFGMCFFIGNFLPSIRKYSNEGSRYWIYFAHSVSISDFSFYFLTKSISKFIDRRAIKFSAFYRAFPSKLNYRA